MAKKKAKKKTGSPLASFISFIAWLTGVLVSLSVGFALINEVLTLPSWLGGNVGVPEVVGWIVVLTTLLGAILTIIRKLR